MSGALRVAKTTLRPLGISITRTEYDEYRVNRLGGSEGTAYYTDDLTDAVATGQAMAACTDGAS